MAPVIKPGEPALEFALADLRGKIHRLSDKRRRVVVLNFWSAVCPWSLRADEALDDARQDWGNRVTYWPIASNADETIEVIQRTAVQRGLSVVLVDIDHRIADIYGAVTTPQFFVIDPDGLVRYEGSLDDVTFRQRTPNRAYLIEAVNALLANRLPDVVQTPAYGCALVRTRQAADQATN
jgi:peroxiredoxin